MLNILARWVISAAALLLTAYLIPGFHVDNFYSALIAALILGIVNALIRPLILFLTLPINILTLGLFTFFINAFLLWFVSTVVKGFTISNFTSALFAAVILWLIGFFVNSVFSEHTAQS